MALFFLDKRINTFAVFLIEKGSLAVYFGFYYSSLYWFRVTLTDFTGFSSLISSKIVLLWYYFDLIISLGLSSYLVSSLFNFLTGLGLNGNFLSSSSSYSNFSDGLG